MQPTRSTTMAPSNTEGETRRAAWFRLLPADGVLTLLLTVVIVYITTFSILSVSPAWVTPGMDILLGTTTVGLFLGYLSVSQAVLPRGLVHLVAIALGLAYAVVQTAGARTSGNWRLVLGSIGYWFRQTILKGGGSTDDTVFLCFLAALTFLLAYISLWLVLASRRPWLALLANAVVMLINLGASASDENGFVIVFAVFALLLLVRFTLAENVRHWRARGIRFSVDLTWDYMQIGTMFSVLVLLIAYLLPASFSSGALLAQITSPQSPWTQFVNRVESVFGGVSGGQSGSSLNFFGSSVGLVGSVHLPNDPVLEYTLGTGSTDPSQYLITNSYNVYVSTSASATAPSTWIQSLGQYQDLPSGTDEASSTATSEADTYIISYDEAGGGLSNNLFAPGVSAKSFSVPSRVLFDDASGLPVAWTNAQGVAVGQTYRATGYVSTATTAQLQAVPFPADTSGGTQYPQTILASYLPKNGDMPPLVSQLATQWTQGAHSMYDAATMIESHLRQFVYSIDNPDPPAGEDATVWFLKRQEGFCTYFASAMALMGRSLGMPTRVVTGFTDGTYDAKTNTFVVRGTNAHAWTQIYFGQYGWINFEPTSGFSTFSRALPGGSSNPHATATSPAGQHTGSTTPSTRFHPGQGGSSGAGPSPTETSPLLFLFGGLLLAVLLLVALVVVWWRALYVRFTPVGGSFARLALLGRWAGVSPQPQQTPREYAEQLATVIPWQRVSLEELADLYAQERWGGGRVAVEPERVSRLYEPARQAITSVIVRRARFAPRDALGWLWDHRPGRRYRHRR